MKTIHTLKTADWTYLFEINKTKKQEFFIKISKARRKATKLEQYSLLVFEEDLQPFIETFHSAIKSFDTYKKKSATSILANSSIKESINKIRTKYPNAYLPWRTQDDEYLELLVCQGVKMEELIRVFGRKRGAILSRIRRLELLDKYELEGF